MTTEINANMKAKVGASSQVADGSTVDLRTDKYGSMLVAAGGGVLAQAAAAGRIFSISNQAAVATTAALTTTWTGLGISNPVGSGKNAIIHEFSAALAVLASDDGILGLMTSDTTGFAAALTVQQGLKSGGGTVMYADDGATIATPILNRVCATYGVQALTAFSLGAPMIVPIRGAIILEPGNSLMTYTTTATTAGFVFHFVWEEVPR